MIATKSLRLDRLLALLICAALILTPAAGVQAQEEQDKTIFLPLIQSTETNAAADQNTDMTNGPAAPTAAQPEEMTQERNRPQLTAGGTLIPGALDMIPGRLTKVPAGYLFKRTFWFTKRFEARTVCVGACDTAMLIVTAGGAWFNDDDPTGGRGSYLCVTCENPALQNMPAEVYIFSKERSSAKAKLYIDDGYGSRLMAEGAFGGTLVQVGPLQKGDFLQVQADRLSNSTVNFDNNDTHMVLFNPDQLANGVLYNDVPVTRPGDWHPTIEIPDKNWLAANNYVVVGKTGISTNSNLGVEARVDLVRGPLNRDRKQAAFPVNGGPGDPIWLEPGRYYGFLYASTNSPVGHGQFNPANVMPSDKCDNRDGLTYYRGQLNAMAFKLIVQQGQPRSDGSLGWKDVAQRDIPLAALGTVGGGRNLFLMELRVDEAAYHRLETFRPVGWFQDITFLDRWEVRRNPDASELKVASFNTLYDGSDYQIEKSRNAADLLATDGFIWRADGSVTARPEQSAWQWEADIVGLQEVKKYTLPTPTPTVSPTPTPWSPVPPAPTAVPIWDRFGLAETFVEEAEDQGSLQWSYVKGRDEDFENYIVSNPESGLGPLFISQNAWPGGSATGIYFGPQAKAQAQCTDYNRLDYAECHLEGDGGVRAAYNYTIPGKATARRYGSSHDRPIAAFNLHLEFESDNFFPMGETAHHRWKEVDALMATIDNLLAVEPDAFNAAVNDTNRTLPQHWQNRMIIMGDFNMNAHACGEHYWILEKLRQHYGYAVDLSMLALADGDDMAMHDRMGDMSQWMSAADWRSAPDTSPTSRFPWWTSTYRGKTGDRFNKDERYDAIFLVGKGWSFDDPFLDYKVLSDRQDPSPMYPNGGGVEMWRVDPGIVTNHITNYAPSWDLGFGYGPGKPALHTDHQPVLARLRIFYH